MPRPEGNIQALERATGIKVLPPDQVTRMGRSMVCYCRPTLKRLMAQYGQSHIEQVIEILVSTKNDNALYSATIVAIAELLNDHPKLLNLGGALYDHFDEIDMGQVRSIAKSVDRTGLKPKIKALIYSQLNEIINKAG